jgi:hypothetical protein
MPYIFIPLLTPMPCHLPSHFLQFCVNGIELGLVYPFYYPSVNPALVLHIPMLPWVWYDQAPSIKPPHTKEGFTILGKTKY